MSEERYHDKHGVPIYPGDLLKTYHFTGARGKRWYMYHVAVRRGDCMYAVPVHELEPTKAGRGGDAPLKHLAQEYDTEIIAGHGPGECIDYTDRLKKQPPRKARP